MDEYGGHVLQSKKPKKPKKHNMSAPVLLSKCMEDVALPFVLNL